MAIARRICHLFVENHKYLKKIQKNEEIDSSTTVALKTIE